MSWVDILKIRDSDISGEFPNVTNETVAEELSDEDIKIEWVERPKGISRELSDYFKITMIYRGEEFASKLVKGEIKYKNITNIINAYKEFLKIDADIRKTFGNEGMDILKQGYRMTGRTTKSPKIFYTLSKPKWGKEIPHTTDEREIKIYLEFYNLHGIYGGIEGEIEVNINSDSSLREFYNNIKKKLHTMFLRKSWRNIIKISETERDIVVESDTWEKEIVDLKREIDNDWGEELMWADNSTEIVGFLGDLAVRVVTITKHNLLVKEVYEMPKEKVLIIYNTINKHRKDYMYLRNNIIRSELFGDRWSAYEIFNHFGDNMEKLNQLDVFLSGLEAVEFNLHNINFDFSPFCDILITYRIEKQMEGQNTKWTPFISFDEIEKEYKKSIKPDIRAEKLLAEVISDNDNITRISHDDMLKEFKEVIENNDSHSIYIEDYLKKGNRKSWVKVITDMDSIFYVNTKTAAISGRDCRLMVFNLDYIYCVMTNSEKIPYGDHVAGLLLTLLNESKIPRDNWLSLLQVV